MELPIALVALLVVVGLAWAAPGGAATLFVLTCLVAVTVAGLAMLARHGRR